MVATSIPSTPSPDLAELTRLSRQRVNQILSDDRETFPLIDHPAQTQRTIERVVSPPTGGVTDHPAQVRNAVGVQMAAPTPRLAMQSIAHRATYPPEGWTLDTLREMTGLGTKTIERRWKDARALLSPSLAEIFDIRRNGSGKARSEGMADAKAQRDAANAAHRVDYPSEGWMLDTLRELTGLGERTVKTHWKAARALLPVQLARVVDGRQHGASRRAAETTARGMADAKAQRERANAADRAALSAGKYRPAPPSDRPNETTKPRPMDTNRTKWYHAPNGRSRRMVGERVKWARQRSALTQKDVGERAGVTARTLHRIETGRVQPQADTLRKLADALSVRVEWLSVGEEPRIALPQMTEREQHRIHNRPGSAGLPGYVIVGPGTRERDESGEWRAKATKEGTE